MKCLVRTEHGVCRQGAVDLVPIVLPTHDYLNFIEEAKLKEIPVCATHAKLVEDGWKLRLPRDLPRGGVRLAVSLVDPATNQRVPTEAGATWVDLPLEVGAE